MTQRFDVQADGEALVRNGDVDKCGAQDAVEDGIGVIERSGLTREPVEKLLVLVERGKRRALAPENVDVAAEAGRGVLGNLVELEAEMVKLFSFGCGAQRPRVAFRSEDNGPGRVEGAKSVHQGRVKLGLRQMIKVVRVLTQIDEVAVGAGRIRPGDDQDGIVRGTFNGPLAEHLYILLVELEAAGPLVCTKYAVKSLSHLSLSSARRYSWHYNFASFAKIVLVTQKEQSPSVAF